MIFSKNNKVLISGASIAGLSSAWWMNQLGYDVTVVETANEPRTAGAAIDIRGVAVDAVRRMGILEELKAQRLNVELVEFKNAEDVTEGSIALQTDLTEYPDDDIEVERDKFIGTLFHALKNKVNFIFNDTITALTEMQDGIKATFKSGHQDAFQLVLGCDGAHSGVRKIWFGPETDYAHFLEAYFSITIVDKLLVKQKTMQTYSVPCKTVMLNAYNNKTDIIFCFSSKKELVYDYRDIAQQREIILKQFASLNWRTAELLEEVQQSPNFYFDKFCQIKMPSWTKGRVVLIGDAGYCASPAAGMGASLAIAGAAALADALTRYNGNFEPAFKAYNENLCPLVEKVQASAELNIKTNFIPQTEEDIIKRNTMAAPF